MNIDNLLRAFVRLYRDGDSLTVALQHEGVPRASYYTWRKVNLPLDTQMKMEAQALAAVEVDLERARAARMREAKQLHIEETLLEKVAPVLQSLLVAAQGGTLHEQVAVLRELRQWLSAGVLDTENTATEKPETLAPSSLPDFLAGKEISSVSIESPSGDKITLERGQVIEGSVEKPTPQ
jgi:site-specific recombinase XerD